MTKKNNNTHVPFAGRSASRRFMTITATLLLGGHSFAFASDAIGPSPISDQLQVTGSEAFFDMSGAGREPDFALGGSLATEDTDGDGVSNRLDNCTMVVNAGQLDTDGDGYGNACDPDLDNSGVVNFIDISLFAEVFGSVGVQDADINGDGSMNFLDFVVLVDYFGAPPGPSSVDLTGEELCASYLTPGGETLQGTFASPHCVYSTDFVDAGNNLTVDLFLSDLPNDGAHIFEGSLFVGESYNTDAGLAAAGIAQGGDGPTLTVKAGVTVAFESSSNFLIVNRGSQIIAVGTADSPITFTSLTDITENLPTFDAVQQWGGIVINGFGVTNKCLYSGSVSGDNLATNECHVDAEGSVGLDESRYGGDNNDDNSGRLEYVRIKHTGATVANGDELNGLSLGGVGRNTTIENVEIYSTFDDGIETFGGAVDLKNIVALYVRDDSIDIDEGWRGSIENALVIQGENIGNHCVEADGIASFSGLESSEVETIIAQGLNSNVTISNLTCIISPSPASGDFDPGTGLRLREGFFGTIKDSLIVTSFGIDDAPASNYCLRVDNRSLQAAQDSDLQILSTVFACEDRTRGNSLPNGTTVEDFASGLGNVFATLSFRTDPTANADLNLQVLEGAPPFFSIDYASSIINDVTPAGAPQNGTFVGALNLGVPNWTAVWTFGLYEGSRDVPLWFE